MITYLSSIWEFPIKIRRTGTLFFLSVLFAAVGCQPIQQGYYGQKGRNGDGLERREYAAETREERSSELEEEKEAALRSTPPGRIKPVGYTTKSFDGLDSEVDSPSVSHNRGNIEWADWQETEEPGFDKGGLGEPIKTAALSETGTVLPAETGISSMNREEEDWHKAADRAIQLLQKEIDYRVAKGDICSAEEARLRLLLLTTGNIPEAAEKIIGLDSNLQVFWERECRGLGQFIEIQEEKATEGSRLKETVAEFQEGVSALKSSLPISVKKSLFVKEPALFGYYEEVFPSFKPGETVNVYFELDNVVCREEGCGEGCRIAVLCRRELTDSLNQPVLETREKLCAGHTGSRLNDIVLNLSLHLPEDLPDGTYNLKTVFLDRNSAGAEPIAELMELRVERPVSSQEE